MAIHHKIPQSRGGPDDDWNLEELSDYDHAYGHALDFVLFEHAPKFDNRQPGWDLLPDDLRQAVTRETKRRMAGNQYAVGKGAPRGERNGNWGKAPRKGDHKSPEERQKISSALTGKSKSEQHRKNLSIAAKRYWANRRNQLNQ